VDVSEPFHSATPARRQARPRRRTYATFLSFSDPDGNTWLVQEVHRSAAPA
jgi:hypothetical protein